MTTVAIAALRKTFSDTLNKVAYQGERVGLERHGKIVAVLVSVEDFELLEDRIDLAAARKAMKEPGSKRWDDVKKELGW